MRFKLFFFSLLLFGSVSLRAQMKINYGFGLDVFKNHISNVDRENFSGRGHSVPGFQQNDKIGLSIYGIVRLPIYKGLGLESGLGFTRYQSQFRFQYNHSFIQEYIDARFNIGLNYLRLPLNAYYEYNLTYKSAIIVTGGASVRWLLLANDHIDETRIEEIGLVSEYKRYRSIAFAYNAGIAYQYNNDDDTIFEFGLNIGNDFNSNFREKFGFYGNLRNAYFSHFGLSLKYFINT